MAVRRLLVLIVVVIMAQMAAKARVEVAQALVGPAAALAPRVQSAAAAAAALV
jgi:hypothetical protein